MKQTRRNFLNTTGLLGATALATGGLPVTALAADKPRAPRIQLGVCTYTFLREQRMSLPTT